ncbi:MAG: class I SAM-dependent methyltransferase [Lachnospiraceae bacterium]
MRKKKGQNIRTSKEDKFEDFFGIESTEVVYNNRYNDDYYRYEPTSYSGLICAFDALEGVISKYDRLVDFGCGKGRVLFYVNQRFQCEVCGIEIDEEVYEQALSNRAYYNTKFRDSMDRIEIINGKAEEYEIHPEDTVFYFFNPFTLCIFEKVIHNILESVKSHPRKIYVMLYYPKEDYRKFLQYQKFSLFRVIKLPDYDKDWNEKMVIYEIGEAPSNI